MDYFVTIEDVLGKIETLHLLTESEHNGGAGTSVLELLPNIDG